MLAGIFVISVVGAGGDGGDGVQERIFVDQARSGQIGLRSGVGASTHRNAISGLKRDGLQRSRVRGMDNQVESGVEEMQE